MDAEQHTIEYNNKSANEQYRVHETESDKSLLADFDLDIKLKYTDEDEAEIVSEKIKVKRIRRLKNEFCEMKINDAVYCMQKFDEKTLENLYNYYRVEYEKLKNLDFIKLLIPDYKNVLQGNEYCDTKMCNVQSNQTNFQTQMIPADLPIKEWVNQIKDLINQNEKCFIDYYDKVQKYNKQNSNDAQYRLLKYHKIFIKDVLILSNLQLNLVLSLLEMTFYKVQPKNVIIEKPKLKVFGENVQTEVKLDDAEIAKGMLTDLDSSKLKFFDENFQKEMRQGESEIVKDLLSDYNYSMRLEYEIKVILCQILSNYRNLIMHNNGFLFSKENILTKPNVRLACQNYLFEINSRFQMLKLKTSEASSKIKILKKNPPIKLSYFKYFLKARSHFESNVKKIDQIERDLLCIHTLFDSILTESRNCVGLLEPQEIKSIHEKFPLHKEILSQCEYYGSVCDQFIKFEEAREQRMNILRNQSFIDLKQTINFNSTNLNNKLVDFNKNKRDEIAVNYEINILGLKSLIEFSSKNKDSFEELESQFNSCVRIVDKFSRYLDMIDEEV
jgi:hypothetical protein